MTLALAFRAWEYLEASKRELLELEFPNEARRLKRLAEIMGQRAARDTQWGESKPEPKPESKPEQYKTYFEDQFAAIHNEVFDAEMERSGFSRK